MRTKTAYSLLTWALLLIALLAPQQAKADAVKDAYKYTINLGGANIIAFRMPVKDDARVTDGKITYTIEGSEQTYTCLTWRAITDSEWKDKTGDDVPKNYHAMEIVLEQPTLYTITPGINYVLEYVGGDANKSHGIWTQKQGSEDEYWVKVEWVVPSDMRGKTVKFHWDVELSSGSVKDLQDVTISVPDPPAIVDPTLTQPVLSQEEKGKIGYAWYIATQNVNKAEAFYKMSADDTVERHMLLGNEANGTVLLDATVPHYHFYIKVDYYDSFDYLIANRMSDIEDVPMLHAPRHFQAKPEDDGQGSVMLTWDTDHPDYPDIFEMDFFEIQRSLTGKEEDFETLTSVIYETGLTHYEYKDSTYLAALTQEHLSAEGYLPPTKYRIRRSSSSIWGWQDNPAAATSTVVRHSQLLLYVPTNSQATWADSTAYTVKVNWDYLPSFAESDDTGTMPADITGSGTEADPYVIHDADGWNTFARWIENDNATYANKHYRLDSDINVMTMVGLSEEKAFKGTFDGNGHTITVDFDAIESYLAPFRYTNGATIRQLRVAGTTIISAKCAAGLIGRSKGSTVENCQVGVSINSTVNGDGTHGGLIAYVDQGTTTIKNSLFNGSLIGSSTNNCGGFVGWTEGDNNAKVTISNCLFAPVQVTVKKPGNTFARTRKTSDVTIANCYYTQPLGTEEGTNASGMTNDELLASLGNGWTIIDGTLKPVMPTYTDEPEFVTPTEGQYWYGWDERAKMTLRIKQYNRVGEHISTRDIALTTSEVKEKTMTVQLSRSCVTHDIELLVNKGTSPLNTVVTKQVTIASNDDFINLKNQIEEAGESTYFYVTLDTDITTLGNPLGSQKPFRGVFDGRGHSIHVSSTFWAAENATLRNIKVKNGSSGQNAGLVRYGKNVVIENCAVTFNFSSITEGAAFVYDGDGITLRNCLFSGAVDISSQPSRPVHAWYGFLRETANPTHNNAIVNCVSAMQKFTGVTSGFTFAGSSKDQKASTHTTFDRCYYVGTNVFNDKNDYVQLGGSGADLETLGNQWTTTSGTPPYTPVVTNTPTSLDTLVYMVTIPSHGFLFESSGRVSKKVIAETHQSSVGLTWDTDGNVIDFFQVLRKYKDEPDSEYKVIATDLTGLSYEDDTVSPLETYIYKVRSAVDCEGLHFEESDPVEGACKHTGKVTGRVQFPDGTGLSGVKVNITSQDNKVSVEVITDDEGYFEADELSYQGKTTATYIITPVSKNQLTLETDSYSVTFNDHTNFYEVKAFVVTSGQRFSGYVMYDGTSIPVKGAGFTVNGHQVKNASGKPVETDFEGKFSFYVNSGKNVIQAVMDGHSFTNNGYFKSSNGVDFSEAIDNIYFYDETTVKLVGRIVGGDTQGSLPLDNNLSHNNLGTGVKMVLTLEGDNTSWLVYDNQKPEVSVRDYTVPHEANDPKREYFTKVHTTRKRIEVSPDSLTGEYRLNLPPVRWKVQQIYSDGYPTLFQEGMVSEVIDLTDCLATHTEKVEGTFTTAAGQELKNGVTTTYNAKYNRIYHAPVELVYKQKTYDSFDYLGDKFYKLKNVDGTSTKVPLATADATAPDGVKYTFGHPVFSLNIKYPLLLSAVERYYWNNDQTSLNIDVVKVGGGKVTIQNGLKITDNRQVVELDENGEAMTNLEADQTPWLLTGDDALRTVTMTLEQDGTNYEAKPIKGYVLNIFAMADSKDILSVSQPTLIDILRDPPGGGSYATLEKGSTLKLSYTLDMKYKGGLNLTYVSGTKLANFTGLVAAPYGVGSTYGLNNNADTETVLDFEYAISGEKGRAFAYTMNVAQDIKTSSDINMVGANADLYIGMVQNLVVTPASTIRAIPDHIFKQMEGQLGGYTLPDGSTQKYGSLVEIASGVAANDTLYHLVRDESLMVGPKVESTFIHSQKYIITQLLPSLVEQCRSLMFIGTDAEAQQRANATGKAVYRSLLPADDDAFAVMNVKNGEPFYYTSSMPQENNMSYVIHIPAGRSETEFPDEVAQHCSNIQSWVAMIAQNEQEKLNAFELVGNYDVDGGSSINYSESFSSEYSISNYMHLPGFISGSFFDETGADMGFAAASIVGIKVANKFIKMLWDKMSTTAQADGVENDKNFTCRVHFTGKTFEFRILPVLDFDVKDVSHESKIFNRKESFHIGLNSKSHLDFDVFRVKTSTDEITSAGLFDVFTGQNFYDGVDYVDDYIDRDIDMSKCIYARSFVYRTRGGATACPWENERKTLFYRKGTILDERTKKIENPKIKLDKQSVSGVAYGEPARFVIYLTNESEQPEAATGGLAYYNLYMKETTNPNGAKLMIDGMPLDGQGRIINLVPGTITQKTLEVFAGEDYDYEGLTIGVMSQEDMVNVWDEVSFDVHYLRTAGNVEISSPSDKWVMNTDAEYNDKRGYFIPVVISGFNKHQKNFDHIEFQYKETARGDDFWTNLCSYFADSTLMASANGVKEMIPENGNITTQFYGEGVVMEKAYDLRAVLYCRNGNSFLTTASKVMSGVKDTRRPQLFGTPEPMNGILGAGENIVFNFSEDIEYNYLSAITNFEVKGEVNNDAVTNDISLQFEGSGGAQTEAERNFADKDITIDMMIHPDKTGKDMPLFAHGSDGKKLQLWITNDGKLKARVNDNEYLSAQTIDTGNFTQVALVIHQPAEGSDRCRLEFYNGGELIGSHQMEEAYTGTGIIVFGSTNEANPRSRSYYSGRMMEARLWYRALSGGQIGTTYGYKRLTGYEKGLMDYWPMNDGQGHYIVDKAQGATLQTSNGVGWAKPGGMSLHIDFADKGLALDPMAINRTSEQDYTLMFWFKTDSNGRGALICNGSGHAEDEGAENQFFIGFESDQLKYRSNGTEVLIPGYWSDNDWHHYAMTVNRAMNVVNIYVDQVLRASIEPEGLGGISGDRLMLGNCVYERMEGGRVKTFDSANYLQGNLDEICLFDQALPLTLIKSFSSHSPQGDEAGLITYLGFQRQERSKDNDLETQPYVYSKKIYTDDEGGVIYERDPLTQEPTTTPQRDYLFADSADVILSHIDQAEGAPVLPEQELRNLNFSFVGRDHSILMNIKNADEKINKRNIYVTMREIPDKNGNAMASAATACFFVDRNPLRWKQKTVLMEQDYGQESTFNVAIQNNSQESHTYTIDSYPKWLTVSPRTNTISPTEEQWITFKVNKDLNVGRFDEIIYLTDENGLSEPIVLSLKVNGNLPEWTKGVDRALRQHSMNITARVQLNNEIDTEPEDIVGVFDTEGVCHGVANISFSEETGESFAFITVYDSLTTERPLSFRLWNHSIGKEQLLVARDDDNQKNVTINFSPSKVVGTPAKPLLLVGGDQYIQSIALYKGWNWVSFNVLSSELRDFHTLLDRLPLHEGDIMTDNVSGAVLVYTNGHWMTSDNSQNPRINHKHAYFFKVQNDVDIHVSGTLIKQKMDRTISLGSGWNSVGYTPMLNLTVQTALTDYNNKANDGDVIKSHDEYAIFTEVNGVGQWKGSLKYMKPGEGYMLYRTSGNEAEFSYPFYEPTSTFLDEVSAAPRTAQGGSPLSLHSKSNMSLTARVEGIELMPGDCLAAYADGERCGQATIDSSGDENIFYLSVAGDKDTPIWFAIEREGEIIATTSELMMFKANAVIGKPLQPTAISFTNIIPVSEGWYTVSGIKLGSKPTQQGVYIHNGNKVVIK